MFHIVFNIDENYIKYLAVLITSIIKNTDTTKNLYDISKNNTTQRGGAYCFHVLTDAISEDMSIKLKTLEYHLNIIYPCVIQVHIIDETIFEGMPKWGFEDSKNYIAYYRLLLGDIIPKDVKVCLYLDVDMFVLEDIRTLFMIPLDNKVIAANSGHVDITTANHVLQSVDDKRNFYFAKIPYYFCSGLMLINMNEWRTRNIQHNSLEFLHKYKSHFADQDALNAIIMGDIVVLPPTFGILIFQTAMSLKNGDSNCHFLRQILTTSKIIHFNGYAKPWMPKYSYLDATYTPLDYPYHEQWWDMARQTPVFNQELQAIFHNNKNDTTALYSYIKALSIKLQNLEFKLDETNRKLYKTRYPHKIVLHKVKNTYIKLKDFLKFYPNKQ